jgi:hypothetical protein
MAAVTLDAIWSALRTGRGVARQADPASDRPSPATDPLPGDRLDEPALTP